MMGFNGVPLAAFRKPGAQSAEDWSSLGGCGLEGPPRSLLVTFVAMPGAPFVASGQERS